jgi:hypothetical protein
MSIIPDTWEVEIKRFEVSGGWGMVVVEGEG